MQPQILFEFSLYICIVLVHLLVHVAVPPEQGCDRKDEGSLFEEYVEIQNYWVCNLGIMSDESIAGRKVVMSPY